MLPFHKCKYKIQIMFYHVSFFGQEDEELNREVDVCPKSICYEQYV
jgi:hypothetical protein